MERDWSWIRKILSALEREGPVSTGSRREWLSAQEDLGWDDDRLDQEKIVYHLNLLGEAGYVRVVHRSGAASNGALAGSLDDIRALHMTMEGHDLLEQLREESSESVSLGGGGTAAVRG